MRSGAWKMRGLLTAITATGLAGLVYSQQPTPSEGQKPESKSSPAQTEKRQRRELPDLVDGLKKTPGCLGVETAQTQSGKSVIFAWFENKKGAMNWFYSETHKAYMDLMGGPPAHPPMVDVSNQDGPILVIASLTRSVKPKIEGLPFPISQIAIELYKPLPGGAFVGSRFAPDGLKVPGMRGYDDESQGPAQPTAKPDSEKKQ